MKREGEREKETKRVSKACEKECSQKVPTKREEVEAKAAGFERKIVS